MSIVRLDLTHGRKHAAKDLNVLQRHLTLQSIDNYTIRSTCFAKQRQSMKTKVTPFFPPEKKYTDGVEWEEFEVLVCLGSSTRRWFIFSVRYATA